MVMPRLGSPPLRAEQRHLGDDWTTEDSAEQHEEEGVEEFPVVKVRQGARLVSVAVHPDWATTRSIDPAIRIIPAIRLAIAPLEAIT